MLITNRIYFSTTRFEIINIFFSLPMANYGIVRKKAYFGLHEGFLLHPPTMYEKAIYSSLLNQPRVYSEMNSHKNAIC